MVSGVKIEAWIKKKERVRAKIKLITTEKEVVRTAEKERIIAKIKTGKGEKISLIVKVKARVTEKKICLTCSQAQSLRIVKEKVIGIKKKIIWKQNVIIKRKTTKITYLALKKCSPIQIAKASIKARVIKKIERAINANIRIIEEISWEKAKRKPNWEAQ